MNEEAVLEKGMNLAVTLKRVPVDVVIAGLEGGLQDLTGPDVEKA